MSQPLFVKRLNKKAVIPKRATPGSAGYDLSSIENTIVPAYGKQIVKTGLAIKTPEGTYGRIAPRSGVAWKGHIDVGAGVVDNDYRGEVGIILFNHSDKDYEIKELDKVAQLILERIATPDVIEVEDLDETIRGSGGFGSTDIIKDEKKVVEDKPPAS